MTGGELAVHLPRELKDEVIRQAASAGVSVDQFIATTLAAKVGAQVELAHYFKARGRRTSPAEALAILDRAGSDAPPAPDDRLDVDEAQP